MKNAKAIVKNLSLPELDRFTNKIAHDVLHHATYEDGRYQFSPLLRLYDSRSLAGKLTPKHAPMIIKHAKLALKYNNPETAFQIMKRGIRSGAITTANSKAFLEIAEEVALPPRGKPSQSSGYVNTIGGDLLDTALSRKVLGKEHADSLLEIARNNNESTAFYKAAIKAGKLDASKFRGVFLEPSKKRFLSTGVELSDNPLRGAVALKHGLESGALIASDPQVKRRFSELMKRADSSFLVWGTKPIEKIAAIAKKHGITV